MPIIEPPPTAPKKETVAIRLEVSLFDELRRYAAYAGTRNFSHIVACSLERVFKADGGSKPGSRRTRISIPKPRIGATAPQGRSMMRVNQRHHRLWLAWPADATLLLVVRLEVLDGWCGWRCFAAADQGCGFAAPDTPPLCRVLFGALRAPFGSC